MSEAIPLLGKAVRMFQKRKKMGCNNAARGETAWPSSAIVEMDTPLPIPGAGGKHLSANEMDESVRLHVDGVRIISEPAELMRGIWTILTTTRSHYLFSNC